MTILTAVKVDDAPVEIRRVLWRARDLLVFTQGHAPVFFDIEQVGKALTCDNGDLKSGEKKTLFQTKEWMLINNITILLFAPY